MKRKIDLLYLVFFDISGPPTSAPIRRALALKDAFEKSKEILCISGKPLKRFCRIVTVILFKRIYYETIYIENSSTTLYPLDFLLIRYFKRRKKKIGIFIRDAHPLFPEFIHALKKYQHILYWGWHYSMQFMIKNIPVWFVPSETFGNFLKKHYGLDGYAPQLNVLPPAMTDNMPSLFDVNSKNILYVGGISKRYGLENLLKLSDALESVDSEAKIVMLIRHDPAKLLEKKNIEVLHGDLSALYKGSYRFRFSVMLLEPNAYNSLAFPLKMMDYLSMGLPVVSTSLPEVERFLLCYKVGIISSDEMWTDFESLWKNSERWTVMNNNISQITNHQWIDRCKQILEVLESSDVN